MDLTVIVNGANHQVRYGEAMRAGLARHGVKVGVQSVTTGSAATVACWGWRTGERLRALGKDVLVMERGYIGDRFEWTSLGWNGLNGRAEFHPHTDGGERFQKHHGALLQPWREGGEYVLLIHQVPGDASLQGRSLSDWYAEAAVAAQRAYGLPVRFREHPVAAERGYGTQCPAAASVIGGDLEEAIRDAAVVLTWNSNTAVESVLAGCPTVAIDPGSMAWPVTGHSIGDTARANREPWAHRLAWRQWTMDEIESGVAWEYVRVRERVEVAA